MSDVTRVRMTSVLVVGVCEQRARSGVHGWRFTAILRLNTETNTCKNESKSETDDVKYMTLYIQSFIEHNKIFDAPKHLSCVRAPDIVNLYAPVLEPTFC